MNRTSRRRFLVQSGAGLALVGASCTGSAPEPTESPADIAAEPLFRISLAQWSLHRSLFGGNPGELYGWDEFSRRLHTDDYPRLLAGDIDPLDFPLLARRDYGIDAVEYVNTFYFNRAEDPDYLAELKRRADGEGVHSLLIMCDAEGSIGDPSESERIANAERHHTWVEAARYLGCHAIRVNAASDPSLPPDEQQKLAADGLRRLCEFADSQEINVLVENHGGHSSNAQWLVGVMQLVDHPRVGTLPDFGNFVIGPGEVYDRYQGVEELMPYA